MADIRRLDRAGLVASALEYSDDADYAEQVGALFDRAAARGDGVAVYENADLGHSEIGLRQVVTFGSEASQLERCRMADDGRADRADYNMLPVQLPDIGGNINWRYRLIEVAVPGTETVPVHYKDDGKPCTTAGSPGWQEGQTCTAGCESARHHYANDGHDSCTDDSEVKV